MSGSSPPLHKSKTARAIPVSVMKDSQDCGQSWRHVKWVHYLCKNTM